MKHYSKFFSNRYYSSKKETKPSSGNLNSKPNNQTEKPDYDIDSELNSISTFVRSGLVVLSVILLSGIAISYGQKKLIQTNTSTSRSFIANKKLPIYCVEQKEKKIALSFDAA